MIHNQFRNSPDSLFMTKPNSPQGNVQRQEQLPLQAQAQLESFKRFNESNFVRLTRHLHRQVTVNMNKRLEACGYDDIATRHLSIFDHLDFGGTNIVTLASRANITKQAMGKLVKEAATSGYISVTSDQKDCRSLIVNFTDKGLNFIKNVQRETNKAREVILKNADVSQDEVITTVETLSRILGYFNNTQVQKELFL
jgi:DNA-binding MarR family transcriptional regulator